MVYFKEEQRFSSVIAVWVILLSVSAAMLAGLGYAFYLQLYLGEPWGSKPLSDNQLILLGVATMVGMAGIDWLVLSGTLILEIRNNALHYKFFPFQPSWKTIKREDIEYFEVRKYAFREFGRHGYRARGLSRKKALTVKGNMGMEITLVNGRKLLIGTQKPEELQRTMEKLMNNEEKDHA